MYKIHLNLDELTLSLLFFTGFDNKFKINLFFGGFGIMQLFPKFTFLFTNSTTCASIFVEEFVHYKDELLPNNKKY